MKLCEQKEKHEKVELHPAWQEFIRFCQKLGYGEIAKITIQDKIPVFIETVRKKIKFGNNNEK